MALPLSSQPQEHKQPHLLVVEDNETNQQLLVMQLERLGYLCDAVESGHAALDAVEQKTYDAVLMDCQMPGIDGLETTRLIRQRETGTEKHLTIIALTANATLNDRLTCLNAGMDDYLSKPTQLRQLEEKLSEWTGQPLTPLRERPAVISLPTLGSDGPPVLDRKSFNSLRNLFGGPTSVKFKETLDLFLNSSEVLLKSLRIAMDNHAIDEVRRIGHTLKSSSASFGAIRLAAQCAALEHAARDGRDDEIETLVRTVETEYDLMRTEIHAERDTTTHD